jgi:hypothetical protein
MQVSKQFQQNEKHVLNSDGQQLHQYQQIEKHA